MWTVPQLPPLPPSIEPATSRMTYGADGYVITMSALVLALVIVAAVLAGIELVGSRGRLLVAWAVEAIALALLLPALLAM